MGIIFLQESLWSLAIVKYERYAKFYLKAGLFVEMRLRQL